MEVKTDKSSSFVWNNGLRVQEMNQTEMKNVDTLQLIKTNGKNIMKRA